MDGSGEILGLMENKHGVQKGTKLKSTVFPNASASPGAQSHSEVSSLQALDPSDTRQSIRV